jgi:hypothetical protein
MQIVAEHDPLGEDLDGMKKRALIQLRIEQKDKDAFVAAAAADRLSLSAWLVRRAWGLPSAAPVEVEPKPRPRKRAP